MYRFITFLGTEILFINQCPLKVISGSKWWLTKVGEKFLSNLVISSIFSSKISLDFYELVRVVPLKYLYVFFSCYKH